jgi:hypothetical protein
MQEQHSCVRLTKRETDYIKGVNSPIPFKSVLPDGNWVPYAEFFERQKLGFETDCCVIFTMQENFDKQMEQQIQAGLIPQAWLDQFTAWGYMDSTNSTDGKPHFHTSPRYIGVLTGNGVNGNPMPAPHDAARANGMIPWTDLPFDETVTMEEFFAPIPQNLLDKGKQFWALIGGNNAYNYHWTNQGGPTDTAQMDIDRQQAPLCIAVTAIAPEWNQYEPPILPGGPNHSISNDAVNTIGELCEDHYDPQWKVLQPGYPIQYIIQGVLSPVLPPPLPPVIDTTPPITPAEKSQIQKWLGQFIAWLQDMVS